jgi:hypothetical protein
MPAIKIAGLSLPLKPQKERIKHISNPELPDYNNLKD